MFFEPDSKPHTLIFSFQFTSHCREAEPGCVEDKNMVSIAVCEALSQPGIPIYLP